MTKTRDVSGATIGAVLNRETQEFIGLYAFAQDATYIRGAGGWITASGASLSKVNGGQMVEMDDKFLDTFDKLDAKGETPTVDQIAKGSTKGNPASWAEQQKRIKAAEIEEAGGE